MFCPNCGKEIPENTKFCNHCGAVTESTSAPQSAPPVQNTAPVSSHKKNNTLIIAVIAAIAVVAIAIVAIFALSGKDDNVGTDTGTGVSSVSSVTQTEKVSSDNSVAASEPSTQNDSTAAQTNKSEVLPAIDGGNNTGKAFVCDMGEYGKMSIAFGYNKDNGVVRQVTASFTITESHAEYQTMKADFQRYEKEFNALNDSRIQCSYTELSSGISCIVSFSELYSSDRAERIAYAEEILDLVADENDYAFYIDDVTALLTGTYGFTEQQ